MTNPQVSIVIATHNRSQQLERCIASVFDNASMDFEIVVVDDASQDDTQAVLRQLASEYPCIRVLRSERNLGPGAARNLGIANACGPIVAILDDDDIAISRRFDRQIAVLIHDPTIDMVFSSVAWLDDQQQKTSEFPGIVIKSQFPTDPRSVFELLYLESNKIPNTTLMARKGLFQQFKYPEDVWIGEDWFLMMQWSAWKYKFLAVAEPLVAQDRGINRSGLMNRKYITVRNSQRMVLKKIRRWLGEMKLNEFDHLHTRAFANQLLRESRSRSGIQGFGLLLQAMLHDPRNPKNRDQSAWLAKNLQRKIARITDNFTPVKSS